MISYIFQSDLINTLYVKEVYSTGVPLFELHQFVSSEFVSSFK